MTFFHALAVRRDPSISSHHLAAKAGFLVYERAIEVGDTPLSIDEVTVDDEKIIVRLKCERPDPAPAGAT